MNYKITLFALAGIQISTFAFAETLAEVGIVEPVGVRIYVDKDTISRRGHLSSINTILLVDPTGKRNDTFPFYFDCESRTYSLPEGAPLPLIRSVSEKFSWQQNNTTYFISGTTVSNIFSIACKKKYEFWK
jgi:hypothetical protein